MTTAGNPSSTTTTPPTSHEPYKLRRARKGRMLAGVAAGLATASGLDVTVVRICIGASMLSGLGIIGYILLWIVIPEEQPARGRFVEPAPENTARVIRIALVVAALLGALHKVGVFWPFTNAHAHTDLGLDGVLALVLLSVGVGVLFSRHRPDHGWWESSSPPPATATTNASPAPADDDDDERPTFVGPFREVVGTVHDNVSEAIRNAQDTPRKPGGAALGWARVVGWFVLLWWVVGVLGVVGLWRYGAINITAPVVVFVAAWAAFTVVLNTLLRVRNPGAVMGTLAVLFIPMLIGAAATRADGPIGTRTLRPVAASEVHRNYKQAIGELELDFGATHFRKGSTDINAKLGAGGMIVTIPNDVSVTVRTKVQTGGYDVLNKRTAGGIGQTETLHFGGCKDAPHLRLDLRTGAGWMQVKRANGNADATCATAA